VLFKDFDKEVKDLVQKRFGTAWKIESKYKGGWDNLYINPQVDGKGMSVDVEYNCKDCGILTKTNVTPNLVVKPKVTLEQGPHKVEIGTTGDVRDLNYEAVYELKDKGYSAHSKVTQQAADFYGVLNVAHHCLVGGGFEYDLSGKGDITWAAGTRYNMPGAIVHLTTKQAKVFNVGVLHKFNLMGRASTAALQVMHTGAMTAHSKTDVTAALETPCQFIKGNTMKFRVNSNLDWAVAVIRDFPDGWKAALSYEHGPKFQVGLQLIRESK